MEKVAAYEEMIWDDILEKEAGSAVAERMKQDMRNAYVEQIKQYRKDHQPALNAAVGHSRKGPFASDSINQAYNLMRFDKARSNAQRKGTLKGPYLRLAKAITG